MKEHAFLTEANAFSTEPNVLACNVMSERNGVLRGNAIAARAVTTGVLRP